METKIHRIRYYNPKPNGINCISYAKKSKLLALARKNASIEIWDLAHAPYLIKFIPGIENSSVEALGWVNDRLLSTGLGGTLVEWDLEKLCIKNTVILTGYAAWCLDVNEDNTLVAVGTEQGYLNLYSVENDEIVYNKLFDKQEGRILCCKFDRTGNMLVTGSIDTIRVWNVHNGQATCRISCSRRGKEVIVWCVGILSDNTIVSGDSHGRLTFWDGIMGDQIETYTTHKTDILTLVISDDEQSLYCSGVDPIITMFMKVSKTVEKQALSQWVKNVQRNIHEHDVRGLALNDERLISVGEDGYLTLSSFPPKRVMRIPPMIPGSRSLICPNKRLILLRYSNYIDVWKLGLYAKDDNGKAVLNVLSVKENFENSISALEQDTEIPLMSKIENNERKGLKVSEEPVKVASIQSKGRKDIKCCDISPSGELIVYATDSYVRMLKLDEDQRNISLRKVLINGLPYCDRVAFTEDSRTMVAHYAGELFVMQVDADAGATLIQKISTEKHLRDRSALHLILSPPTSKGIHMVVADAKGDIAVWVRQTNKFKYLLNLPKYKCVPSALTLHENKLVVVYVDQKVIEYDIENQKFTGWPTAQLPAAWTNRKMAVNTVSVHPRRSALVFNDETSLWVLDKHEKEQLEPTPKKNKNKNKRVNLKVIPMKYLAGFHWLGEDEAVAVEILPENIVSQLPPIMAKKKHNME